MRWSKRSTCRRPIASQRSRLTSVRLRYDARWLRKKDHRREHSRDGKRRREHARHASCKRTASSIAVPRSAVDEMRHHIRHARTRLPMTEQRLRSRARNGDDRELAKPLVERRMYVSPRPPMRSGAAFVAQSPSSASVDAAALDRARSRSVAEAVPIPANASASARSSMATTPGGASSSKRRRSACESNKTSRDAATPQWKAVRGPFRIGYTRRR